MEMTVEAVNKTNFMGFKPLGGEGWLNADKKSGLTFKELHPGDVIKVTQNAAKFVTAYELVTAAPPQAAKKVWSGGSGKGGEFRTPEQVMRSVAVEAVFTSPLMAEIGKDMTNEKALAFALSAADSVFHYIEKGA